MNLIDIKNENSLRYYTFCDSEGVYHKKISVTSLFSDLNKFFTYNTAKEENTFYRDRGNLAHTALENEIRSGKVGKLIPLIPGFKKALGCEEIVIHDWYAGRYDLLYENTQGDRVLMDLKTITVKPAVKSKFSNIAKATIKKYSMQLVGYNLALTQPANKGIILFLKYLDGETSFVEHEVVEVDLNDPELIQGFLGQLAYHVPECLS